MSFYSKYKKKPFPNRNPSKLHNITLCKYNQVMKNCLPFAYGASLYGSVGVPGPPTGPPAPPGPPLTCMEFLRCNIASCGDMGGNGTPRFGGLPGLEL